ncbi:HutD/Ves family protein [Roseobacteraceae bacterium NS-SX3]
MSALNLRCKGGSMRFDAAKTAPVRWKNGGGLTRELAVKKEQGHLIWRISLADIRQDGPFSAFPGLARIHIIIRGAGLDLIGSAQQLKARPLQPLRFDGGAAFAARLEGGPCQAFNVMYDPACTAADARVIPEGPIEAEAGEVIFVVCGSLSLGRQETLGAGQGAVLEAPATGRLTGGSAIAVRFTAPQEGL